LIFTALGWLSSPWKPAMTPYDIDLDRSPANFQPLTPLTLLERAASVFPGRTAIIHGALRRSYAEFYRRARTTRNMPAPASGSERSTTSN